MHEASRGVQSIDGCSIHSTSHPDVPALAAVSLGTASDAPASERTNQSPLLVSVAYQPNDFPSVNPTLFHYDGLVRVSVVIPALNEAANLPHVLPSIPAWVHEVLLVDGHSTDGTIEVARQLNPGIRIVRQTERGKGAALKSGFAAATGDIIVMLDADGSTAPSEIPAFVGALLAGADFVKGSRFLQGGGTADMPLYRKLGNHGFVLLVRALFGGSYSDLCYGYNAFWSRILPVLDLDSNGFEVETLMNVRALCAGLKIAEVPSFEYRRIYGSSNLRTIPDGWRVLKTICREWVRRFIKRPQARIDGAPTPTTAPFASTQITEAHWPTVPSIEQAVGEA